MKFRNITLCNIRNFKGEQKIDMTPHWNNKKRNIILIGGFNGSGKTTIVEAIRLCLFGRKIKDAPLSSQNYYEYLLLAKNKSSVKDNDNRFFTQIEIEIDDTYPAYLITLRREWEIENGKMNKEYFTIYRDGIPLEIIPRDYWEDYVISIIPPFVTDYFFFDGERVKELASGNKAERILKESIRDLIGLKLYETLADDLNILRSKIKRRNIDRPNFQKEFIEREKEISEIENKITKIGKNIKDKSSKIEELKDKKIKIEDNLQRKAGVFAKERKRIERKILKLKEDIAKLNNKIKQICSDFLPFIIASETCDKLLDQLEKEKRLKKLIASKHMLKEINRDFIKKIDSSKTLSKFSKKELDTIKTEIDNIFSELFNEVSTKTGEFFIHNLTDIEMATIENILIKTEENIKMKLNETLKLREKNLIHTKNLKEKLKNVPDESFVKEYIDMLSSISAKIEVLENDINFLKKDKLKLQEKKAKIEENIGKLEEEIVCREEDQGKIELCSKIRKSIQEFNDIIIFSKIDALSTIITVMYRKLANKEDMVKEIKIDPHTLSTKLIDFNKNIVNKNTLSAGEKEIYALSVLWGLAKISNKKLPLILDSPLAKLDKSHVDKIIENFFPNAGEQVIILSHDREIDPKSYKKFKHYLNRTYRLAMSQENKIVKGYFFD